MSGLLKKLFGGDDDAQHVADDAAAAAGGSGATGLLDQASELLGGKIPDIGELQKAVDGLSQPELQNAATSAMQQVDGSTRTDFGKLLQGFLNQSGGAQAPAGVASGDPNALGQAVSGVLKGQGGLGALAGLFSASGGAAPGAAGAPATGGVQIQQAGPAPAAGGAAGAAGGLDIGALLSNPMAKAILAALIPAIMKAFQGKQ
ncbi:MAG TPA: hypothetical protein VH482_13410 [Thermomicrobiales bacterium]|jgi:hypothetical protein